ncbi:phospholipase D-like domain-containing protein [Arthrobacter sp. B0490]|uniref:phospholipase D-like domain-containing protein n=1 Tax=Arthrobacter sp. B0490 TaxID=2058891 RepID=UPI0011B0E10F|nr:phospholipase D-like domain-containing protein [Arthrobacter sp. B0490]
MSNAQDIISFLGLDEAVIVPIMADLVRSGDLAPRLNPDGSVDYQLTQQGKRSAEDLELVTPKQATIELSFDGITHNYISVSPSERWRPQDLKKEDILEIPAFPADPPSLGPADTQMISRAVQQLIQQEPPEILSVLGVTGRRTKFFVRAIALVFQSLDALQEISVQFAIDGRRSPDHERAFAVAEGQRKLGILDVLADTPVQPSDHFSPTTLGRMSEESDVRSLRLITRNLQTQISSFGNQEEISNDESFSAVDRLTEKLHTAQSTLEQMQVRVLEVEEHPTFLEDAVSSAKYRLMIISPWLRTAVIDTTFIHNLTERLKAGVQVLIGYGIGDDAKNKDLDERALKLLTPLSRSYPNLRIARLGNTHAKVLIKDDDYVIITSFNWLSFRGDPNRPFRDERGTLVRVQSEINAVHQSYEHNFQLQG